LPAGRREKRAKSLNGISYHFVPGRRPSRDGSQRIRRLLALEKLPDCLDKPVDSHVLVLADTSSSPENASEFGRVLERFAQACRAEPGCLSYEIFRSTTRPERFMSIERYADVGALAAHRASAHFKEIGLGEVMPLVPDRDIVLYGAPIEVPPVPAQ
jgi:quinol monooxygenase YgiN